MKTQTDYPLRRLVGLCWVTSQIAGLDGQDPEAVGQLLENAVELIRQARPDLFPDPGA